MMNDEQTARRKAVVAGFTKSFLHSAAINLNPKEQKVDHGSTIVKHGCQPLISENPSSAVERLHKTNW
jgi:hypothetical protein